MEIIGKTNNGFIINATEEEVKDILKAVFGNVKKDDIDVGCKIPAYDYTSVVRSIKEFRASYEYNQMKHYLAKLFEDSSEHIKALDEIGFEE